jgi:hypothetical protein
LGIEAEEMTHEEILNMPAGREMDALIAEKVMGVKLFCFCPSTDIAAAWQVVDYFAKKYGDVCLEMVLVENETLTGQEWCVSLRLDADIALADTAPLAICRAALLAVKE